MPLTRREFSTLATGSLALLVLQQADAQPVQPLDRDDAKNKANLATAPFTIGGAGQYAKAGLYEDYKKEKGVWIVSDGKTLVVLSATCTHKGCTTAWNAEKKQYGCPCHKSQFDKDGLNISGRAERPLERCALRLVKGANGAMEIEVDPTHRFRKEKDEWSDPAASLPVG
jgi:Rieske Fe-S protein